MNIRTYQHLEKLFERSQLNTHLENDECNILTIRKESNSMDIILRKQQRTEMTKPLNAEVKL